MDPKYLLLILMSLATNCFQITDYKSKIKSNCILRVISEFFGNTSTINIIFEDTDEIGYLKNLEIPFLPLKSIYTYKSATPNFVIHIQENNLEYILHELIHRFRNLKIFIIMNVIDDKINTVLGRYFKFNTLQLILLVDDASNMFRTYQPTTNGYTCKLLSTYPTITKKYCDTKLSLIEYKSFLKFSNCQVNMINMNSQKSVKEDQFSINTRIIDVLANTLNVTINIFYSNDPAAGSSTIAVMAFLTPTMDSAIISGIENDEMVWVVPKGKQLRTFLAVASTYDKTMCISILLLFSITYLSWCLLIHFTSGHSFPRNYVDCFFVLIELTLSIPLSQLPRSNTFRIILVSYVIYSLQVSSLFSANLVRILTAPAPAPKFEEIISSLEELVDSNMNIVTLQDIYYTNLFSMHMSVIQHRLIEKIVKSNDTISNVVQKILEYRNISLLIRKKWLPKEYESKVNIIMDHKVTNPINFSLYFMKNQALKNIFNKIIRRMHESGLTNKMISDDLPKSLRVIEHDSNMKPTLNHLLFAFLLLGAGLLFASLLFLAENIWKRCFRKSSSVEILL